MRRLLPFLALSAFAADWPEWRGAGRAGVWTEDGILDRFPENGLRVRWRAPVKAGYSGPSVSAGRVFLTDFEREGVNKGKERAIAFDEKTGRPLWAREWTVNYAGLAYGIGPRATPTVDGERVFVLGAKGMLKALAVRDGAELWSHDFVVEYKALVPGWGMTSAPIVAGPLLIAVVSGEGSAKVVAFDKASGKEVWRALESTSEPGYSAPILVDAGGRRQLIVWHASAVSALDPGNGEILWQQPFRAHMGLAVATPVVSGRYLFTSSFYTGPMLLELAADKAAAALVWKGKSESEIQTDGLHALINTPAIDGDYIYGICSYGQLRCLNLRTGERVWETLDATGEKARWATGFLVKHGDRYFLNNDRGDLIVCKLTPEGYREISRTKLIKPTTTQGIGRRSEGAVNWSHPAYAGRHIFARNDEELISASLAR